VVIKLSIHFPCRLIIDPPQSGAWNMAVDEVLLGEAATAGIATLRFYEWIEPTLSLGYFQNYATRGQHSASASAVIVRRQSGGGAILHDHELTYSLALPRDHPLAMDAQSLYKIVHREIAAVLRKTLQATQSADSIRFAEPTVVGQKVLEPFLCFQRRSAGDLVFLTEQGNNSRGDHKIVGSAQRRSRGAILQHGSILVARSECAPELAGLNDLCDTEVRTTYLANELSARLPTAVGLEFEKRTLSNQGQALATKLQDEKYGNRLWTQRR
jgi:lipoate-protein ligase A